MWQRKACLRQRRGTGLGGLILIDNTMKIYTAFYSTKAISNIQYSFVAEDIESAVEFCKCNFPSAFPKIVILENSPAVKANEGLVVWANGNIVL